MTMTQVERDKIALYLFFPIIIVTYILQYYVIDTWFWQWYLLFTSRQMLQLILAYVVMRWSRLQSDWHLHNISQAIFLFSLLELTLEALDMNQKGNIGEYIWICGAMFGLAHLFAYIRGHRRPSRLWLFIMGILASFLIYLTR